ncbi:MAG: heavy-metal-associated domain-containing protein, partial [Alphaproteobacteria bacterium]
MMQTKLLKVTGMTCDGCVNKVAHALTAVTGVSDVNVSLPAGEAVVQFDDGLTSPERLQAAVRKAGFGVDMTDLPRSRQAKG